MSSVETIIDRLEIINSIPDNELQTAIHLYNYLLDIQYAPDHYEWKLSYHRVRTSQELFDSLTKLANDCSLSQQNPLVHIECHESPAGLVLCDGDSVKWAGLRPYLYRLNRITRNQFSIVMGSCWGFHGARTIEDENGRQRGTAIRLLAGLVEESTSAQLEGAFKKFYSTLVFGGTFSEAIIAAKSIEPLFHYYTAEQAFISGWKAWMSQFPKTNKEIYTKTEELVTRFKWLKGLHSTRGLHRQIKRKLKTTDQARLFNKAKRQFFMLDSYPEVEQEVDFITFDAIKADLKIELK